MDEGEEGGGREGGCGSLGVDSVLSFLTLGNLMGGCSGGHDQSTRFSVNIEE